MNNIVLGFNEIVSFIEEHLTDEIDYTELGQLIGYSPYHLQRLFLMLTNTPISEYIRNRRLASAAFDLLAEDSTVTDIAYKYGYSSPTSFNRAFKAFHGVTPKDIKKGEHVIKAYPPLRFELSIKGASPLDYKIVTTKSFRVVGKKIHTTMENSKSYRELPAFWQEVQQTAVIPELLAKMNQAPFGLLGVSDYNPNLDESAFDYYIGVASTLECSTGEAEIVIPEMTWAAFKHPMGTPAELQEFQRQIVMDWLPTSGYEFAFGPDLEVYGEDNSVENWIPVTRVVKK
ncbi:AraC family transcriptional regulator [Enterococcus sp. PF1-24]|uniref:AraC family transcriptional regulator n=1 Tax=unclassified Enterococcus TaxID=2608891 RepID=UPI002474EFF4|nr:MULTISPECIES: AraC family transcriptional regulator [unclassified Enterococcus]MDH6364670.1 AraC family transcriptional regulator [Enterococcus sp. PFB1-1]MDH6401771.1 AraC family transcriptional regulator [Enterococcus sp. PF1-24]